MSLTIDGIGIGISTQSMQQDMRWLDVVAHNVANLRTTGFRRKVHVARLDGIADTASVGVAPPRFEIATDFQPGALEATKNATDLAIEGPAFFEVLADGVSLYTKKGLFRLDGQGQLVTREGYLLMGRDGPIQLDGAQFTVRPDGEVRQGDRVAGIIQRVAFEHPETLSDFGKSYFVAGADQAVTLDTESLVRQGMLEASNVNATQEMLQVVWLARHFEATQRLLLSYDLLLDKTIQSLGTF